MSTESRREYARLYNRAWRKTTRGAQATRASMLKSKYGLTLEQYKAMHETQDHKCLICEEPITQGYTDKPMESHRKGPRDRQSHVDHCHETGKIRGLLCSPCNSGLGHFKDSVYLMQRAIEHVNRHAS